MDHLILSKSPDWFARRKKKLVIWWICCSSGSQSVNEKDRQMHESNKRAGKAVEHESDGDTNCCWSTWNSHQILRSEEGWRLIRQQQC